MFETYTSAHELVEHAHDEPSDRRVFQGASTTERPNQN